MRKLTDHRGVVVGPGESTVDIDGTDSLVLSATDGWVKDVIPMQDILYITIRTDTTVYAYADIDRPLVSEGQRIIAGQPIAIARQNRIEFYVSNYLGQIFRNPAAYVDCICELPKEKPEN